MTDLLARLAARHVGAARLLKPKLPGMFEPQGDTGPGFIEETVERPAAPPRTAQESPPEPESCQVEPTRTAPRPADPPRLADPDHAPAEPVLRGPETAPEPPSVRHVTHETQRDIVHETWLFTQHDHVRTVDREDRTPATEDPPLATAPVALRLDPAPKTTQAGERREPAPNFAEPPPSTVVRMIPRQEETPRRAEPAPPPERMVEVHIGHIEIRTTVPAKPKARLRRSATNPAPDLNTYLGGRS